MCNSIRDTIPLKEYAITFKEGENHSFVYAINFIPAAGNFAETKKMILLK